MDKDIIHTDWSHLRESNISNNVGDIKNVSNTEGAGGEQVILEVEKHRPFFFWFFVASFIILLLSGIFFGYKYYFDQNNYLQ